MIFRYLRGYSTTGSYFRIANHTVLVTVSLDCIDLCLTVLNLYYSSLDFVTMSFEVVKQIVPSATSK